MRDLISSLFRTNTRINSFQQYLTLVKKKQKIVILATKYVMFIANLLSNALQEIGIKTEIIRKQPLFGYNNLPHIVIAPQSFRKLPKNYIAYQVEQLEASTWFTDEYRRILENSIAIFDYSKRNIEFLEKIYLDKRIFFLPISPTLKLLDKFDIPVDKKEYDITFYGGTDTERRQQILKVLSNKYNLRVLQKTFGNTLYRELSKSKIVINIHNFDDSLLETTRIFELLSLNSSVIISEKAIDQYEHCYLEELVEFVDIGDVSALMSKIDYYLSSTDLVKNKLTINKQIICSMKINDFSENLKTIIRM